MGLSTGPVFVSSLRRAGLRWNILALAAIATVAGAVVAVSWLLGLGGPKGAGFFTGVLTNTPALAAVVEKLHGHDAELPVVAYSLAYPVSVISSMIAISVLQRLWRIDYAADSAAAGIVDEQILNATAEVRRPLSVTDVIRASASRAIIGRVRHNEHDAVAEPDQRLEPGDLVTIVGTPKAVADATRLVGEASPQPLDADRSHLDVRRIFMSNPKLVGQCIDELQLADRFGAAITRVRREDTDMLAEGHTVLELGDRIRVVAPPERMKEVSRYFGDSYRELGELNIASLSLGLALGLLVGALSIPLPGGGHFSIGFAGGPLVVGLLLGAQPAHRATGVAAAHRGEHLAAPDRSGAVPGRHRNPGRPLVRFDDHHRRRLADPRQCPGAVPGHGLQCAPRGAQAARAPHGRRHRRARRTVHPAGDAGLRQ